MTRRELYKQLKENKLFSKFCTHLAEGYDTFYSYEEEKEKLTTDPKDRLEEFFKYIQDNTITIDYLVYSVKHNWTTNRPKIIYGGKNRNISPTNTTLS